MSNVNHNNSMPIRGLDPFNPTLAAIPAAHPLVYDLPAPNGCGKCIDPRCNDHDLNLYLNPILLHPPPLRGEVISYFVPTDADKYGVRVSMDCLRRQKHQVAARMKFLMQPTVIDELLTQSRSRCDDANSQIDASFAAYASVLAPFRSLTPSALEAIFMACVEQAGSHVLYNLSLVCKRWQETARTPHLWTNIAVLVNIHHPPSFLIAAKFINNCYYRSANRLLRFRLEVDYKPMDSGARAAYYDNLGILANDLGFQELADKIADTAPRWLDATMVSSPAFLKVLARVIGRGSRWAECLPRLYRLTIDVHIREDEDFRLIPMAMFLKAPNLRRVTYSRMDVTLDQVPLPWTQITHCSAPTVMNVKKLLLSFPNLVTCDQAILTPETYDEGPMDLRHDVLRNLDLRVSGRGAFELFFEHCELPSLVKLRLHSDQHWLRLWSKSAFHRFLWRSSCLLQTLVLDFAGLTTHDLLPILESVPTLCELHVIDRPIPDMLPNFIIGNVLMERLAIFFPPLLPNLRVLKLGGMLSFDLPPFFKMAQSRFAADQYRYPMGCTRLQSLVVYPYVPLAGSYSPWRTIEELHYVNKFLGYQVDIQRVGY